MTHAKTFPRMEELRPCALRLPCICCAQAGSRAFLLSGHAARGKPKGPSSAAKSLVLSDAVKSIQQEGSSKTRKKRLANQAKSTHFRTQSLYNFFFYLPLTPDPDPVCWKGRHRAVGLQPTICTNIPCLHHPAPGRARIPATPGLCRPSSSVIPTSYIKTRRFADPYRRARRRRY